MSKSRHSSRANALSVGPYISMSTKQLVSFCAVVAALSVSAFGQSPLNQAPSRVLGTPGLTVSNNNPNYVDGREMYSPIGVALDTTVSPPILYVADGGNNRVLAWRNAASAQNGARADLVIGQRDFTSTLPQNPGAADSLSSGFAVPSGLAVDSGGNLYVADAGNNRVLRFPQPFAQQGGLIVPDIVIGQPTFTSRANNGGSSTPTETGLSTSTTTAGTQQIGIYIDAGQALWVTDALNHRVLRFPASVLNRNNPPADLVLGQANFNTRTTATGASARINKRILNTPSGITMDSAGRVFVTDDLSRLVAYFPPFVSGMESGRIAGVVVTGQGRPPAPPTIVNNVALGAVGTGGSITPAGVFALGAGVAVADRAANRIVQYAPVDEWPAEAQQFSPPMSAVIGQPDFTAFAANAGQGGTNAVGLSLAITGVSAPGGNEIYVADTANHRVVRFSGPPTFSNALQVFGQDFLTQGSPNLLEGREFFFFNGYTNITGVSAVSGRGPGIAFDGDRVYVADTYNHRVLGFRDAKAFKGGDYADIVIGQDNRLLGVLNAPSNNANVATDSSLYLPAGVAVDANGDLYVADSGNSRILRFPRPFDQPPQNRQQANLVLGQAGFSGKFTDPTSRTMSYPYGLAFTANGSLLASDAVHNRVLFFARPDGGDFTNGQDAALVFGQPDFSTSATNTSDPRRLVSPHGIAVDTDDRLYVCDTGRARVVIYDRAPVAGIDPTPAFQIQRASATATTNINSPHSVFVSRLTGEIWVTNTRGDTVLRYPLYNQLTQNPVPDYTIRIAAPLAVAQDQFGNLYVGDARSRIAIHYPTAGLSNAGNFVPTSTRPMAPNTYLSVFRTGAPFSAETVQFSTIPMPTSLIDVQVLLNSKPLPLHFVSPDQINALITNDSPTSGNAEVLVVRQSTGQILAATTVPMGPVAPALFTSPAGGNGQLAAINQDGTQNSQGSPAPRGSVVELYGTGLGALSGAPPDGEPPGGQVPGPVPDVILGTQFLGSENILYSGLSPSLIGVWQINIRIPESVGLPVPAGTPVPLSVRLNSVPNNLLPQRTFVYVKQQ